MNEFKPGDIVWVVERDDEELLEITGIQYMATCGDYIIGTSWINDYDFEDTLAYHVDHTSEYGETELVVYPISDCFDNKEDAEAMLKNE